MACHHLSINCPEHFVNGQVPDIINQKLSVKARDVCYLVFSLKHSRITLTPIYSAEHLTRDRLAMAKGMKRSSKFYPDPNIVPMMTVFTTSEKTDHTSILEAVEEHGWHLEHVNYVFRMTETVSRDKFLSSG